MRLDAFINSKEPEPFASRSADRGLILAIRTDDRPDRLKRLRDPQLNDHAWLTAFFRLVDQDTARAQARQLVTEGIVADQVGRQIADHHLQNDRQFDLAVVEVGVRERDVPTGAEHQADDIEQRRLGTIASADEAYKAVVRQQPVRLFNATEVMNHYLSYLHFFILAQKNAEPMVEMRLANRHVELLGEVNLNDGSPASAAFGRSRRRVRGVARRPWRPRPAGRYLSRPHRVHAEPGRRPAGSGLCPATARSRRPADPERRQPVPLAAVRPGRVSVRSAPRVWRTAGSSPRRCRRCSPARR